MFKIKKKEKIILFVAFGIICIFLLEKTVFSGFRKKMKELSEQIVIQESAVKKGLNIQKSKDVIAREYQEYSKFLIKDLNDRDITAEFLKEIEKITRDSGLSVVDMAPEEKFAQAKEYKEYKANLRLEGGMEKLLFFLNKVQNSNLLIKLSKLSFISKDERSGILRIDATVSLIVPLSITEIDITE